MQMTLIKCPRCGCPMHVDQVTIWGETWRCWACGHVTMPKKEEVKNDIR